MTVGHHQVSGPIFTGKFQNICFSLLILLCYLRSFHSIYDYIVTFGTIFSPFWSQFRSAIKMPDESLQRQKITRVCVGGNCSHVCEKLVHCVLGSDSHSGEQHTRKFSCKGELEQQRQRCLSENFSVDRSAKRAPSIIAVYALDFSCIWPQQCIVELQLRLFPMTTTPPCWLYR